MLSRTKLNPFVIEWTNIVREFVNQAIDNQIHPNDVALIIKCGLYLGDEKKSEFSKVSQGFVTGMGFEQFAEKSNSMLLRWYLNDSPFGNSENQELNFDPSNETFHVSIRIETLFYLSFWESDTTLHILYQLVRLASGKRYDWYWRQKFDSITSRQKFFREHIKNPLKKLNKSLYHNLDSVVRNQIRNAIAHSQFVLLPNSIKLLNHSENPKHYAPEVLIGYSEWEKIIYSTVAFRNELVSVLNKLDKGYKADSVSGNGKFSTEIEKEDGTLLNLAFKY
ncbi:MAG: hypothetical protein GC178_07975 [Flavobacteriales bacterium]|nr:hypothetical protein [Flavobacteriales bacterium]